MKIFENKIIVFATCIFFLQIPSSSANSLIDNNAFGYVQGDITQNVSDGDYSEINIGSIISNGDAKAKGVNTQAYILGDIIIEGSTRLNIATVVVR